MILDVTNKIHYNSWNVTNERPRGYYLDLSDVDSGTEVKFRCDLGTFANLRIIM